MKKCISLLLIGILLVSLAACGTKAPETQEEGTVKPVATGNVVEIKEKFFITLTNEIYQSPSSYLGDTIQLEGIFDVYTNEFLGKTQYYCIRYGPGCCGTDGNAGFEIEWDGEWPEQNDWIKVSGILEEYSYVYEGLTYIGLRLDVQSLEVLEERGEEYVLH